MSRERWSKAMWEDFLSRIFSGDHVSFIPHKIFRWDKNGIYQDCFFPVPCQHLLGGEHLLGRTINEVLPKDSAKSLKKALIKTLKTQRPQDVQLVFPTLGKTVVAVVRLFPYESEALGFVTDHYLDGCPVISVTPQDPSLSFLKSSSTYTM